MRGPRAILSIIGRYGSLSIMIMHRPEPKSLSASAVKALEMCLHKLATRSSRSTCLGWLIGDLSSTSCSVNALG